MCFEKLPGAASGGRLQAQLVVLTSQYTKLQELLDQSYTHYRMVRIRIEIFCA